MVEDESAALSRLANRAISRVYKTPLHGWCYPQKATPSVLRIESAKAQPLVVWARGELVYLLRR